jgi:hypothetical protein
MKIKKFIKSVAHFLGLGDYKIEGKKKALKDLIKKLNKRKREMKKAHLRSKSFLLESQLRKKKPRKNQQKRKLKRNL